MNVKHIGVLAILCASIMWAVEPIFAKLSYENSDFVQTSAIRAIVVTFTGAVYTFLTNKANFRVDKKQLSTLIYIALVGSLFADLVYFYALTRVAVINAILIGHLQPVFIVVIGFFLLKEDVLTKLDYIGILLMMMGALLVTTKTIENFCTLTLGTIGDVLVLSATIAWATAAIAMRKYLKEMNAGVVTFYRFLFASLIFIVYLISTSTVSIANIYQVLVGIVVGIGMILYFEGLKRIKAAQVAGLELFAPFFGASLGFFILKETVTFMQICGSLILIAGVYFLSKKGEI